MAKSSSMKNFLRNNSLSLVFGALFLFSLIGQVFTGLKQHNLKLEEHQQPPVTLGTYLTTGHFLQATMENWESEFLQMALFVLGTVFLYQKGSSESKDPESDEEEEVDRQPDPNKKDAPWPVHKGGLIEKLYQRSLFIALFLLFLATFYLHLRGSMLDHNEEQVLKGAAPETMGQYITNSRFWFESFQNWQSEFLAVFSLAVLSIFLRQKGSPQSKPVDAPNSQTGE